MSRDEKRFCLPNHNANMIYIANLSYFLMFFIYKNDDDKILAEQNISSTMIPGRAYTCTQVHENSFFDVTHKKYASFSCLNERLVYTLVVVTYLNLYVEWIYLLALRIANTLERIGLHNEPRDTLKLFFGDDFCLETQCLTMVVVFVIPHTRWHI